ncbi:MAG: hypothetical protein ACI9BO_002255 [Zhongshania sp.]|jgi:hypothetical protein
MLPTAMTADVLVNLNIATLAHCRRKYIDRSALENFRGGYEKNICNQQRPKS